MGSASVPARIASRMGVYESSWLNLRSIAIFYKAASERVKAQQRVKHTCTATFL